MDEKNELMQILRSCRRRLRFRRYVQYALTSAAVGGGIAIVAETAALFVPFYRADAVAVFLVLAGFLTGLLAAFVRRSSLRDAARMLDRFGLQERTLTAYERLSEDSAIDLLQRQDALLALRENRDRIRIPLQALRPLCAVLLAVSAAALLSFVPSAAKDTAAERHALAVEAKAEQEKAEDLLEELAAVSTESLTEAEKQELSELMESIERSMEELSQADSREALSWAKQKLSYKQELAQEYTEPQILADGSTGSGAGGGQNTSTGKNSTKNGDESSDSAQNGTESGDSARSGDGGDNGSDASGSGQAGSSGEGSDGDGSSSQNGSNGSGQNGGSGNGTGNGEGSSNGSGTGEGSGTGSGTGGSSAGTGSSDTGHDYVSVSNELGDDDSIASDQGDSDDSDYYRAQNGLAWTGEHVSLDSVIAEYSESAYEGLASGKYPSGMEDVIRSYFESLN